MQSSCAVLTIRRRTGATSACRLCRLACHLSSALRQHLSCSWNLQKLFESPIKTIKKLHSVLEKIIVVLKKSNQQQLNILLKNGLDTGEKEAQHDPEGAGCEQVREDANAHHVPHVHVPRLLKSVVTSGLHCHRIGLQPS